jgi:hypothetical protein
MSRIIAELLQKAQKMQSNISETRQKLASRHVEAESENKAVKVVASCDKQIVSIEINTDILGENTGGVKLAKVIADTSNEALKKAEIVLKEELNSALAKAGINLPGLF